jgi:ferredoxin
MALKILQECIACDACFQPCPTGSIIPDDPIYKIDPSTCTECVGHADEPTCVVACPVDCIVIDEDNPKAKKE